MELLLGICMVLLCMRVVRGFCEKEFGYLVQRVCSVLTNYTITKSLYDV